MVFLHEGFENLLCLHRLICDVLAIPLQRKTTHRIDCDNLAYSPAQREPFNVSIAPLSQQQRGFQR